MGSDPSDELSTQERLRSLRRRRVLQVLGGAGSITLAGCGGTGDGDGGDGDGGGDGGGGDGDGDGDDGDVIDNPTFTEPGGPPPDSQEANPYNVDDNFAGWSGPDWVRPTVFNGNRGEWYNRTVENWDYDGETMTIEFNDNYTWTDGETITAEDFVTRTVLNMYTGAPIGDFLESIEATEEFTVVATLDDEFAGMQEEVFLQQIFHWSSSSYAAPSKTFGEYVERFRNAENEDEIKSIQEDLLSLSIPPEDATWSGVAVWEERDERRQLKKVRDDFPNTDDINFTDLESIYGVQEEEGILGGAIDSAFSSIPEGEVPGDYEEQGSVPVYMGHALLFQHDHELYGMPEVRQAIGHMMDNQTFHNVIETHGTHLEIEHQTGMPPQYAEESLGGDTDFLTDYSGHNHDRAAELLQEAGFSQDGDTWMTPNGEEWTPEVYAPEWWPEIAQFAASELQAFGLNAEARSAEWSTFNKDVNVNGDFGLAWTFIGATFLPISYYDFEGTFKSETFNDVYNIGPELEVPMPVGDPEGDLETVDAGELVDELLFAESDEEAVELVKQLSWIYNQALPAYQFDTYSDTWVWNTEDWDLPDDDHWLWHTPHPMYLVFEEGEIQAAPGTSSQV